MREALFYTPLAGKRVRCCLCQHFCEIADGRRGLCGVRENQAGTLYTLVYGLSIATSVDPIEKKPIFHLLPGSTSYSIATVGCNFNCRNCQNWEIAQYPKKHDGPIPGKELTPDAIVRQALDASCSSIAYTYTEPTIFFEYADETAKLASQAGLKNVFVTNGYASSEAVRAMAPYLDAVNVDLKSFRDDFYQKICGAKLQPVLDTIGLYCELGIWVEVTTLIIPGYNDDEDELRQIAAFIANLGVEIPWHVSAFHPNYKLTDAPRTSAKVLRRARQIGLDAGLRYVYEGNVPGEGGESTYCYNCGELLIERFGYAIRKNRLKQSRCHSCSAEIDGIGMDGC